MQYRNYDDPDMRLKEASRKWFEEQENREWEELSLFEKLAYNLRCARTPEKKRSAEIDIDIYFHRFWNYIRGAYGLGSHAPDMIKSQEERRAARKAARATAAHVEG